MTVNIVELLDSRNDQTSRDGRSSRAQRTYRASGSTDELEVRAQAHAQLPAALGSVDNPPVLWRQTVDVRQEADASHWRIVGTWDATQPDDPPIEDSLQGSTIGGSEHITQSLETVSYVESGTPVDTGGAIGLSDDRVSGVEIPTARLTFTVTRYLDEFSWDYRSLLWSLAVHMNDAPFAGLDTGEVLYLGTDFSYEPSRKTKRWALTFKFVAERNRSDFMVGDIPVPFKRGHDAMTVQYAPVEDEAGSRVIRRPIQVDVHRVYEFASFAALQLDAPYI